MNKQNQTMSGPESLPVTSDLQNQLLTEDELCSAAGGKGDTQTFFGVIFKHIPNTDPYSSASMFICSKCGYVVPESGLQDHAAGGAVNVYPQPALGKTFDKNNSKSICIRCTANGVTK
ncbi:MAG: hypothetical protein LBJ95_03065 [Oscillospiraceae bacterium]|nr:hypothetical protein [Oscillospiraceae bacterium]